MSDRKSLLAKMRNMACGVIIVLALVVIFNNSLARLIVTGIISDYEFWVNISIGVSALAIVICVIVVIAQYSKFNREVIRPVSDITAAVDRLTKGKPTGVITIGGERNEIYALAECVNILIARMGKDIEFFERMKEGDYSLDLPGVPVTAGGEGDGGDRLKRVIQDMIDNQRGLVRNLKQVSDRIAYASAEMAGGSQDLASGSNQQAAAIEEFSAAVDDLKRHAEENAALAREVVDSIKQYASIVQNIGNDMELMTDKMNDISESSERISSVSDIIENIAFQTNILALNAAVEAAHAGAHGKGFAVVADEVRQLSSKSAAAARETADLIRSGIENVRTGNKIVEDASAGMTQIKDISVLNEERMSKLNEASAHQSAAIGEISNSINQISLIVQTNSALAEESASSALEMSEQSHALDTLVDFYTIEPPKDRN
jgi:methyl-accepting chemotaxis protein